MIRYTLTDPTNNEIKYEGEIDNIDGWYDKHKNDDWVKRLRKIYKKPVMNIIPQDRVRQGRIISQERVEDSQDRVRQGRIISQDRVEKHKRSDEHKLNLSKSLGHKCIINGVHYTSIKQAQKKLNLGYLSIKKLME